MNVRKPTDYSAMFAVLETLMAVSLPQMELYLEIGKLISSRPEKGAAVAAAEYLGRMYPNATGFSPRNLRRMREFCRTYESAPEVMAQAMTIGWTQNVIILEAELTLQEKTWYIRAVRRFGWSKLELARQITSAAHLEIPLDLPEEVCNTEGTNGSECVNDDENPLYPLRQHLLQPNGQVYDKRPCEIGWEGEPLLHRICLHQHRGVSLGPQKVDRAWHQLHWENGPTAYQLRLRQIRPSDWDGLRQSVEYVPRLQQRFQWQDTPADGVYRPPGNVAISWYMGNFETMRQNVLAG